MLHSTEYAGLIFPITCWRSLEYVANHRKRETITYSTGYVLGLLKQSERALVSRHQSIIMCVHH